eukprot:gene11895-11987_t
MTIQQLTPDSAQPALRLRHISKRFGGVLALNDVSFEVGRGEVHCLAGENGCGKSTIIKIITGVYTPESGAEMEYFGETVSSVTPNFARSRGIAVIWQDFALFPEMTVAENIAFDTLLGNRPRLVSYQTMRAQAITALAKLKVDLDLDARLNTLPIAQRQVVAIARALVSDARLIFMDEPTASLTQAETDRLLAVVRTLSAAGVAVVFVSHRLAEVLDISSRVTVLRDGRLVGVYQTEGMTQSRLTELMTGKTFEKTVAAKDISTKPVALEVENLSRSGEYDGPQSIADNMVLPVLEKITGTNGLISQQKKAALVNKWLSDLAVKIGKPEDAVSTLSGGNQQRVVLAKWLATEPKVLILDSPTVGVDVGARAGIYKIIRALAEQGLSILLISDEVSEVHFNTDRILHMAGGKIIHEYDPRHTTLLELEAAVYA